jgi:pimeloyl-ACP methyl ester carboxylesterase
MPQRHLILLHGFLENTHMWDEILRGISKKDFVIHRPHLPGHHPHTPILEMPATEAYHQAILKQLTLSSDDEVIVIGHSMGGYLASSLVFEIPAKVRGLCLFHAKCGADDTEKIIQRQRAIDAAQANLPLYVRTMIQGQFGAASAVTCASKIESQIYFAQSLEVAAVVCSQQYMMQRADQIEAMKNRSFPLYYFLGEEDPSIPLHVAMHEVQQLPGTLAHVEPRIGHMGHWECTRHAAQFINRIIFASFDQPDN